MEAQNIEEILKRWADKIYPSPEVFVKALKEKKLTIYHGVDPTAPQLHLGHSTNYLLLQKFQEMGHKIILLIGDFTAQIGDPTGKSAARQPLTEKQIKENYKSYKEQAGKILDFKSRKNPVQVKFNSKWLGSLTLKDVIKLTANFTHGQMIKRNMFQERLEKNQEIYIHEFLYPLLQGYDSVAMDVDGEVGGTDQTFNMLVGRDLLKIYKDKEKFVVTTPLLENPKTGKKLMSKSEGNYIALNDAPKEMYGKVMALPDEAIIPCFKLCTELPLDQVIKLEEDLKANAVNPRDVKAGLAKEIVALYYGQEIADKSEAEFDQVFKEKNLPTDIPVFSTDKNNYPVLDLLVDAKMCPSKSEAKRLVEGGAVTLRFGDKEVKVLNWKEEIVIEDQMVIQVGKRKFIKIKK